MPIYEYRCEACGNELEALQKISDAPLEVCPACDASTLKKKISAAAFRLKGGGWYETDFKSGNKKNLAGDKSETAKKEPEKKSSAPKTDNAPKASASADS